MRGHGETAHRCRADIGATRFGTPQFLMAVQLLPLRPNRCRLLLNGVSGAGVQINNARQALVSSLFGRCAPDPGLRELQLIKL
jgi:hypothetical protein